jgi:hypothetical protein
MWARFSACISVSAHVAKLAVVADTISCCCDEIGKDCHGAMMAKRPRSHVIEDLAAAKISAEFSKLGWTVEPIRQDYGEDFVVTIFENGIKRRIQSKGILVAAKRKYDTL